MNKWKLLNLFLITFLCFGFRTYFDGNRWNISNDSTASRKLFVVIENGSTTVSNDVGDQDPAKGLGDNPTVDELMTTIFNDYNNINASFLTLVDDADGDFAAEGDRRTITIKFSGGDGLQAGQAELEMDGDIIIGCDVGVDEDLLESATDFLRVMTHEIGHCIGLDHPQESTNAIMSYFSGDDNTRLMIDDKMGIVFLFPKDPAGAEEKNSFGLSCGL